MPKLKKLFSVTLRKIGSVSASRAEKPCFTSLTDTLHIDILLEILEILHAESPTTLTKVALVSRQLYTLTQQFNYRSIRLILNRSNRPSNRPLLRRLIANKALSANIRTLWIPWAPKGIPRHGDDGSLEDLHLLAKLFPNLDRLRTFMIKQCPRLERLSLTNYLDYFFEPDNRVQQGAGRLNLTSLTITNLSFLSSNLAVEPTHLRSLCLRVPGYLTPIPQQLGALRSFLFQCGNLEDLDVKGVVDLFDKQLLAAVGKSLRSLRVQETKTPPSVKTCLSAEEIGQKCPKLRKLGIDICHNQRWVDWPYDEFSSIGESLSSLIQLDVHLHHDQVNPWEKRHAATLSSVHQVWDFLWKAMEVTRRRDGVIVPRPRLQSINVVVGSKTPGYSPYISERSGLYEHDHLTFQVRLSEREEEARIGIAHIRCLELEALRAKFGADPPANHWQVHLLQGMIDRVEHGKPLENGTDLNAARDLTRPLRMPALDLHDS